MAKPMIIKQVNFETVLPIWENQLWPNRKDPVKPTNNLQYLGGRDKLISEQLPVFFAVFDGNCIVGVNSGLPTLHGGFRSRGIWVDPAYRKKGVGAMLLNAVIDYARSNGYSYAWSMPRQSALHAYTSVGYIQTSDFFDEGVEFGPNCFVRIDLVD